MPKSIALNKPSINLNFTTQVKLKNIVKIKRITVWSSGNGLLHMYMVCEAIIVVEKGDI